MYLKLNSLLSAKLVAVSEWGAWETLTTSTIPLNSPQMVKLWKEEETVENDEEHDDDESLMMMLIQASVRFAQLPSSSFIPTSQ